MEGFAGIDMYAATIIIPAHNEEKNIAEVIKRVRNVSRGYEILVVDDGSTDNTSGTAEKEGARIIKLKRNHGKGFACLTGSRAAKSNKLVFIDADMQLRPEEIPKFVSALDGYDLVIGTRDTKKIPMQRRVANKIAASMISRSSGRQFKDVLCGFRAIKKEALTKIKLEKKRYEFESEMLLAAAKAGIKIAEVPVSVSYESYKGMGVADSFRLLLFILKKSLGN